MEPEILTTVMGDLTFTTVYTPSAMTFTFAMEVNGTASPSKTLRVADAMASVAEAIRREVGTHA